MLPYLLTLAMSILPPQAAEDQQTASPPAASLEMQLEEFGQLRRLRAKPDELVQCLHAIGEQGTDEAVDALLRLLSKLDGELAQAAVHGIALSGTPYAADKLRILARDRTHPEVRRQACLDLSRGSEEDLLYLRDKRLPKEKDLLIRGEILRRLIDREVPRLDRAVLKASKSKDKLYASVGVYGIGKLKLEKGLRMVEDYLTDPDLQLRLESMRALATFGGAASFETLLRAYSHANNLALQPDIEKLLQGATSLDEVDVLIEDGLRHESLEVVGACASALSIAAELQPERCAPELLKLLDHEHPRIRDYAIEGLVRAHPDDVVRDLIAMLGHEHAKTRTTAAWALAQLGDLPASLAPQLILLTDDARAPIRLHAVDALKAFPDSEDAFLAALARLEDRNWSVRAAAIATLRPFRRPASIGPLVKRVEEETGRVRDDAVAALCDLTGEDFGPALNIWSKWYADLPESFLLPSAEDAQARLADLRARRAEGHQSIVTQTYHGVQVPQGGVVFVMDVSGSMMEPYRGGVTFYDHFSGALADTIALLDDTVQFNIVSFSSGVQVWKEQLTPGSPEIAQEARQYLSGIRPEGPTNLYGALMTALSFPEVQTIFLLTDGDPTFGRVVVPSAILAELERVNRDRNVVINTIAAGDVRAEFLADLAVGNGGETVDLTDGAQELTGKD